MTTGTEFFIHLSQQQNFLKNFENDPTRNVIKTTMRCVVASIALVFFAKIGFYYNLLIGTCKGAIGVITLKRSEKVFGKKSSEFFQESKVHILRAIVDLTVTVFKIIFILIYAIYPMKTQDGINKLLNQSKHC